MIFKQQHALQLKHPERRSEALLFGRRARIAVSIAVTAALVFSALALIQLTEKPSITVFPSVALAGNPVKVGVNFPPPLSRADFSGVTVSYGDGTHTTEMLSTHVYLRPGIYRIVVHFERNGEQGTVSSQVKILPYYFETPSADYGDSATYRIAGGYISASNPYGIISRDITYDGISATIKVDAIHLVFSGNESVAVGLHPVLQADGLGYTHVAYQINSTGRINGNGYLLGQASGTALNISLSMEATFTVSSFFDSHTNSTVVQNLQASIRLNADYEGQTLPLLKNGTYAASAFGEIYNGTLAQNSMIDALDGSSLLSMPLQQRLKYVSGVPKSLSPGISGVYRGYEWKAWDFMPSLNNSEITISVVRGDSYNRTVTLDERSFFPLAQGMVEGYSFNGTNVSFGADEARTGYTRGETSVFTAGVTGTEARTGNYTVWNEGSRIPHLDGGITEPGLTEAYSFALNNTGLAQFLQSSPDALFLGAYYNFSSQSWYIFFGNVSGSSAYRVYVSDANGTLEASGAEVPYEGPDSMPAGEPLLTPDSALNAVNGSAFRNSFYSGNTAQFSLLYIGPGEFIPQMSQFLPAPGGKVSLVYTFTSYDGSSISIDALNGQIMYFLSPS